MTPETPEGWRFKWAMEPESMLAWLAEIKAAVESPVVVKRKRKRRPIETRSEND